MGKGLTGIRKSAKETLPDEEGSELTMQTSLLAIANKAKDRKHYRFLNLVESKSYTRQPSSAGY